ncbi:hypothetical protein DY000_02006834 [Brassica cretica]|uniref:DOG1 domain-containing protein n=1 Tax=Brassica cretica TaxID=69181 RepID=A0ABQ7BY68_BRACR|nr:hypothetical protein DY000_02006834 [Brassica cretica]
MVVDEQNELPEATPREAEVQRQLDGIQSQEPKLTSNTKPDITACLGAWYTWDRILQTSLEAEVMPVLLRSGQSASREEAVEKRNVCR